MKKQTLSITLGLVTLALITTLVALPFGQTTPASGEETLSTNTTLSGDDSQTDTDLPEVTPPSDTSAPTESNDTSPKVVPTQSTESIFDLFGNESDRGVVLPVVPFDRTLAGTWPDADLDGVQEISAAIYEYQYDPNYTYVSPGRLEGYPVAASNEMYIDEITVANSNTLYLSYAVGYCTRMADPNIKLTGDQLILGITLTDLQTDCLAPASMKYLKVIFDQDISHKEIKELVANPYRPDNPIRFQP
jgi:hypothetical protein